MHPFKPIRWRLRAAWLAPLIAGATVAAASLADPAFDHARRYISELGGAGARSALAFNLGLALAGAAGLAGAVGVTEALRAEGGRRWPSRLTGLLLGLGAFGMLVASAFPYPDPRHRAIELGFGMVTAPLAACWALHGVRTARRLQLALALTFAGLAVGYLLAWNRIGRLVGPENVGWWERGFGAAAIGWIAVLAWVLERRAAARRRAVSDGASPRVSLPQRPD